MKVVYGLTLYHCDPYNCDMTPKACAARRAKEKREKSVFIRVQPHGDRNRKCHTNECKNCGGVG